MMHSLGIIHEQSRSDRDKYVDVRFNHIKPSKGDFFLSFISAYLPERNSLFNSNEVSDFNEVFLANDANKGAYVIDND